MRHPFRTSRRDDGVTLSTLVQTQLPPSPSATRRSVRMRIATSALVVALVAAFLVGAATNHLPTFSGGTSTGAPARGGSIVDGMNFEPDSLLPMRSTGNYGYMGDQVVWAPLWYGDPQGAYHAGLAKEVPSSTNGDISPDLKTWTIHLRSGLKWSDGTPLTADDCVFSYNLYADPAYTSSAGGPTGFPTTDPADPIGFVSAMKVDATTFVLRLKHPWVLMSAVLVDGVGTCLPKEEFSGMSAADVITSPQDFWPKVVSGPFTIAERVKGNHMTVVRNPYYYQGPEKPYLDQITFEFGQDPLAALRAHSVDTAWYLDPTGLASYRAIDGYTTYLDRYPVGYELLVFNMTDPLSGNLAIRQAFTMGFNTNEVLAFFNGAATLTCDDAGGTFAHQESLVPCYHYFPAGAGRILDADGWVMGADGVRHKNGQALELQLSTTGSSVRQQTAKLIQRELAGIGMKIDVKTYGIDDYFGTGNEKVLAGGHFQIAEFGTGGGYDPDDHWYLSSDQTPEQGGDNYMRYANAEVDQQERVQQGTADIKARTAAFHIIQADILKDLPVMYLAAAQNIACARSDLHNYMPSAFSVSETWNVWDWWLGANGR